VAAPTASLHFDEEMVRSLQQQSVDVGYLSLHVGQGTFIPISCENVAEHPIHSEEFEVSDELRQQIISTKQKGGRVIAAGTTVCRALEASAAGHCGQTDLMIMPGFNFKVVDGLLTNFHTPRSTLLALVAAVAEHHGVTNGMNFVKQVYADAIRNEYRFYSYGDSSLWLKSAKID
jgi:S-adenosylmethionine:tRNA ribosyltransferase-isomerase